VHAALHRASIRKVDCGLASMKASARRRTAAPSRIAPGPREWRSPALRERPRAARAWAAGRRAGGTLRHRQSRRAGSSCRRRPQFFAACRRSWQPDVGLPVPTDKQGVTCCRLLHLPPASPSRDSS
jgi:hypothetical protein